MSYISQNSQISSENQVSPREIWVPFQGKNEVRGGISLKSDGSMSFGRGELSQVANNRKSYFENHGLSVEKGVGAALIHSTNVERVSFIDAGRGMLDPSSRIPDADALITNQKNLILTTTHADCAPICYFDPIQKIIALAHAGWRGILAGLPGKVIAEMTKNFQSKAEDILVEIGPMISVNHYPVSDELAEKFIGKFGRETVKNRNEKFHLDLCKAIQVDLLRNGFSTNFLLKTPPCTYENLQYSSFRRDGESFAPMMVWISLL